MEYISERELARKCKDGLMIALVGRDDEENTRCAVEICREIKEETTIYFSLKEIEEEFRIKYPNLQAFVLDTAAIEVERLVEIVKEKQSISQIKLVVIDYLNLLSSRVEYETRKKEIEANVRVFKELSKENIPLLILLPLSKYTSKDMLVIDEMRRNGFMPELFDVIAYVQEGADERHIQELKDENGYVHYGDATFVREKFESIENKDFSNKPDGGLWASSCGAENSWCTWCEENDFKRSNTDKYFYFYIADTANVLRIESLKDCEALTLRPVGYMHEEYIDSNYKVIDYRACMERGIDAIEYKYDIASQSEDFEEIDTIMWGWDCDSILILNPDIIVLPEKVDEIGKKGN